MVERDNMIENHMNAAAEQSYSFVGGTPRLPLGIIFNYHTLWKNGARTIQTQYRIAFTFTRGFQTNAQP